MTKEDIKLSLMNPDERSLYVARKLNSPKKSQYTIELDKEELKGDQGEKGDNGQDGKDGKDGRDGQDGQDGKDGIDGKNGRDGRDGQRGLNGKDGQDGKDGENPNITDIIKELKKKQYLEPKDIKGMPINMSDMRWHGGGLSTVSHDSTMTGNGTPSSPLSVVPTGLIRITITGTVNGGNNIFTAASKPTWIVSDGVWYEERDYNNSVQWTYSAGTITTVFYPQSAIFGF